MSITILRAGPLTTLQDAGRFGKLGHGISASGPMDHSAFATIGALLERVGTTGIEYTQGISIEANEPVVLACAEGVKRLAPGDRLDLPPAAGNYGYLRFEREIGVPLLLGSRSTNVTVGLGGFKGRPLKTGDRLPLGEMGALPAATQPVHQVAEGPIRVIWGLHADLFDRTARARFLDQSFTVTAAMDRMGVRLGDASGIFRDQRRLSLVSDFIVPGDIQILGDGTPIVLMRDHQATGGYPRIATIVAADLDRFAQMRPGTSVQFRSVTLEHAR